MDLKFGYNWPGLGYDDGSERIDKPTSFEVKKAFELFE